MACVGMRDLVPYDPQTIAMHQNCAPYNEWMVCQQSIVSGWADLACDCKICQGIPNAATAALLAITFTRGGAASFCATAQDVLHPTSMA